MSWEENYKKVLEEGKQKLEEAGNSYESTADFTEDMTTVESILHAPKFKKWAADTDAEHGLKCAQLLAKATKAYDDFVRELESI